MFNIDESKRVETDIPLITSDYRNLLYDEIPVLFIGSNATGQKIVGSSVDEDYHVGFERYMHVVLTDEDFERYITRAITYRALLEQSDYVFIVNKFVRGDEPIIYRIKFSEVPEDHRPTSDTFIPLLKRKTS